MKLLKKPGFRLSFPIILLLIAVSLYGFLLVVTRLPQNDFKNYPNGCSISESEVNILGINTGCNTSVYQIILLVILGLIVCGPSLIVLKLFSIEFISEKWTVVLIIFSFLVYFLIDYLIRIIFKNRKKY